MISYTLSDIDNSNIYQKTLQIIEDICDAHDLNNDFGTISMANQIIVDYLSDYKSCYSLEVCFQVDNDSIDIQYNASQEVFSLLESSQDNYSLLMDLADKVDKNADNKTIDLCFHVKPKFSVQRQLEKSAILHKTYNL